MGVSSFDCIIIVNGTVHEHGLVLPEGSALFGLVQDIYPHHFSGAILYHDDPLFNAISNKEISSIDVLGLFVLENLPFTSSLIVAWLSWYRIICSTS